MRDPEHGPVCTLSLSPQLDKVGRDYERELQEQLRIQMDAHTHHLAEAMQTQVSVLRSTIT